MLNLSFNKYRMISKRIIGNCKYKYNKSKIIIFQAFYTNFRTLDLFKKVLVWYDLTRCGKLRKFESISLFIEFDLNVIF